VVDQKGDSPVYEVKPELGSGKNHTLHRNLLLLCDVLPLTQEHNRQATNRPQRRIRTFRQTCSSSQVTTDINSDDAELLTYTPVQLSDRSNTGDSVDPKPIATAEQHVPLGPGTKTMASELSNQEPTELEHCDPAPADQETLLVPHVHTQEKSRLGREPDLEQME